MAGRLQDVILRDTRANQPAATAVAAGTVYFVTDELVTERSNGSAWQDISDGGAGDVGGPGSATDNALVRFDGTTGKLIQNGVITESDTGALTFPDDVRQTFNPGTTVAGINVGSHSGNPSTPTDGDVWYNSSANQLYGRVNSATFGLGVVRQITLVVDGGGAVITTGVKGYVSCPFSGTITKARLISSDASATSGSIVIDVWKDTYANYPPTDADSITASAPPTLSSANKSEDTTLTGWTTTITAGDILGFNVDSATTVTKVTLELSVRPS